jgi:ribosomal protein L37E
MARKERCSRCGSKKIVVQAGSKKCEVCGYQWSGRIGRKTSEKKEQDTERRPDASALDFLGGL